MDKLTQWLIEPLVEDINIPVEIGDTVLMGRFKNKKVVVKSIDYNEKGDLLINNKSALKFRIMKKDEMLNYPHYLKNVGNVPQNNPDGEHRYYDPKISKKKKKKNEDVVPSPSRKMVKKMKKKGNTSVPYGSGYKKVSEANAVKGSKVSKFITGHNLTMKGKKYKEIDKFTDLFQGVEPQIKQIFFIRNIFRHFRFFIFKFLL